MQRVKIAPLLYLAFMIGSGCGAVARADEAADRAARTQDYHNRATAAVNSLADLLAAVQQAKEYSKGDIPLITAYMKDVEAQMNKAAELAAKGDLAGADAVANKAQDKMNRSGAWNTRLWMRQRQAQAAPTEELFDSQITWRPGGGLELSMEAKKRVSDAYGKLAEVTVPDASQETLYKAQDDCFRAELAAEVADVQMNWAADDNFAKTTPDVKSPELTEATERLQEYRKERIELYCKFREMQHQVEVMDRKAGDLSNARYQAWAKARSDWEQAQPDKKP